MKALILAAGYATRLYPLTKNFPKSLLTVDGKPIIDHIVEKLSSLRQIDEIIVVTNSKFFRSFKNWKRKVKTNKKLTILDDLTTANEDRRGAIGDINFAIRNKKINDDLLVIGGDNLFQERLDEFLLISKTYNNAPVIGVYDLKDKVNAKKYGVLKLDRKNRVIDFQEKPEIPNSSLVGMCLYYFPKERLGLVSQYTKSRKKTSDATGSYIDWLRGKVEVYGFIFRGRWYDIGDFKYYNQARKKFKE